jgi:hypothetical protein
MFVLTLSYSSADSPAWPMFNLIYLNCPVLTITVFQESYNFFPLAVTLAIKYWPSNQAQIAFTIPRKPPCKPASYSAG